MTLVEMPNSEDMEQEEITSPDSTQALSFLFQALLWTSHPFTVTTG